MAQACAGKRQYSEVVGKLAYCDAILSLLRALPENRGKREVIEFARAMDAERGRSGLSIDYREIYVQEKNALLAEPYRNRADGQCPDHEPCQCRCT